MKRDVLLALIRYSLGWLVFRGAIFAGVPGDIAFIIGAVTIRILMDDSASEESENAILES